MNTRNIGIMFLILTFSTSLIASEKMSAEEVTSLLSNNTMNGKNLLKNSSFTNYFNQDGTAVKLNSKGKKKNGTWRVTEAGEHCTQWGDGKKERCGAILKLANDTYQKMSGDKAKVEFTVSKGNSKGL